MLFRAPDVKLVTLFSPEHGIRGLVDAEVRRQRGRGDRPADRQPLRQGPQAAAEDLEGLDVLVYDIQDIGARFYTYISTLGLVLEAAEEANKEVVGARPAQPDRRAAVAGPVRDAEFASFIAYHALPVRHGMTVGELARLFNAERKIGAT